MRQMILLMMLLVVASVALADPPYNDTCEDALFLIDQGFTSFDVDLCAFNDDYAGCGEVAAAGPDAVWQAVIQAGEEVLLVATPTSGEFQAVMYLVTDCGDPVGSCVAVSEGDASVQTIDFEIPVANRYYLIVDALQGCGTVHVEMGGVLATEVSTWSEVKALY